MKVKLYLNEVLIIKDRLETLINETIQQFIVKKNSPNKTVRRNSTLILDALLDQQIEVKEVIHKANLLKCEGSKTNAYFIYKLSTLLKKRRDLYSKIKNSNKQLKQIDNEMDNIRNKLSRFNEKTIVTINIDESLKLIEKN